METFYFLMATLEFITTSAPVLVKKSFNLTASQTLKQNKNKGEQIKKNSFGI